MVMEKKLLVSLISQQTIPNVQLIKEMNDVTDYFFISTEGMKNEVRYIIDATGIASDCSKLITIKEYDIDNIKKGLATEDYSSYKNIYVNLTGGTKIMTLAVLDFYSNKEIFSNENNVTFYYIFVDGNISRYFTLDNPNIKNEFKESVTLREYLLSYGFSIKEHTASGISMEVTIDMYKKYCEGYFDTDTAKEALNFLRGKRKSGVKTEDDFLTVKTFLDDIGYIPQESRTLTEKEVKYITGEWFEEYIGSQLKKELNLNECDILIGAELKKKGANDSNKETNVINEFDVMFMYKGRFHTVECKTSIFVFDKNQNKNKNILGETIYKTDALKAKFGLYASSAIVTMTHLEKDIFKSHKDRAELSKIKLVGKNDIENWIEDFKKS